MGNDGKKRKGGGGGSSKKSRQQEEVYVVEKLISKKVDHDGVLVYQVKWKDWPEESNTWEPLENLTGCEDLLREFNRRERGVSNVSSTPSTKSTSKSSTKRPRPISPSSDSGGENEDETTTESLIEVLDVCPPGKKPQGLVGVVPINSVMTYLVRWEKGENIPHSDEEINLIRADVFRELFPQIVIDYYETKIVWAKKDIQRSLDASNEKNGEGNSTKNAKSAKNVDKINGKNKENENRGRIAGLESSSEDEMEIERSSGTPNGMTSHDDDD